MRGLMNTLMELKHIVLIDFVLNNTDHYRHDVVGLEDESQLKNLLQSCIEFVIKNEKSQFEMSYFQDKPDFPFTLEHKKSWVLDSNKEETILTSKTNYPCFRITLENIVKNSKLYCTVYSFDQANINWFSEFSKDVLVDKINSTAIAVEHFREILEERDISPDKTNLKVITKVEHPSNKKTLEKTDLSVTEYCYSLLQKLKDEPKGTATHFKFIEHPLFETNYPGKLLTQYWLVADKSVRK